MFAMNNFLSSENSELLICFTSCSKPKFSNNILFCFVSCFCILVTCDCLRAHLVYAHYQFLPGHLCKCFQFSFWKCPDALNFNLFTSIIAMFKCSIYHFMIWSYLDSYFHNILIFCFSCMQCNLPVLAIRLLILACIYTLSLTQVAF